MSDNRYDTLPHAALVYKAKFEAKKKIKQVKVWYNSEKLIIVAYPDIHIFITQCQISFSNTFSNSINPLIYFSLTCTA